jgi:hypothetical protein
MAGFRYSPTKQTYRDGKGRAVADVKLRQAVAQVADGAALHLSDLTERFSAGELPLTEWEQAVAQELKLAHLSIGMVARGGRAAMTQADWGYIGQGLRAEYAYLTQFARQVEAGTAGSAARLKARVKLYAQSARLTFERIRERDAREVGLDQERNVLGASESCVECPALSARGYVPAGTLPPVGSRACLVNCKCVIQRRRAPRSGRRVA